MPAYFRTVVSMGLINFFRKFLVLSAIAAAALIVSPAAHAQNTTFVEGLQSLTEIVRANPDNRQARWRLAQMLFRAGRPDLARTHVQLLLRTASSQGDLETLTAALAEITEASPWDYNFGFSLRPSTNIRRYTYNDRFETLIGNFTPVGGGVAQSGIGYALSADLSYSIALEGGQIVRFRTDIDHTIYSESDLDSSQLRFGVAHETFTLGRFTRIEPYLRLSFDHVQQLEKRDIGLSYSNLWWFDGTDRLRLTLTLEDRTNLTQSSSTGPYGRLNLNYSYGLSEATRIAYSGSLTRFEPNAPHQRYWGGSFAAEITHRYENVGALGLFGTAQLKDYDGIFPGLDTQRRDETLSVGISFSPQNLIIFEARPNLRCELIHNRSNVALYDYEATDCSLTLDRSF